MEISAFTDDHRVVHPLDELKQKWSSADKQISDIVDDEGRQYVDLVMEGGGVLGIALVGYTYALESVGIRFLGVGGTSAGAINALLVAAAGPPAAEKSLEILRILADLDMFEFVDGDGDARDFVRAMVEKAGIVKLAWKGMQVIDNLTGDLGLNPGDYFFRWLRERLAGFGVRTTDDLRRRMRDLPKGLRTRDGKKVTMKMADPKLALVTSDVTTETKAVFPDMADLYWADPDAVNPAHYVRASMSIPGFFHPYRVKKVPTKGPEPPRRWKRKAGYLGRIPTEAVFVDGGIMSNFPIDIFHVPGVPAAPTLGVKLGTDRMEPHAVERPGQLLGAIFNAARHNADYDFIAKNPDYRHLVAQIDTGGHFWLNFFMPDEDKVDLFARGVRTAADFLKGFDWEAYKEIRAKVAKG